LDTAKEEERTISNRIEVNVSVSKRWLVVEVEDEQMVGQAQRESGLGGWIFVVVRILKLDENKLTERTPRWRPGVSSA
jgi:hypothetical protein